MAAFSRTVQETERDTKQVDRQASSLGYRSFQPHTGSSQFIMLFRNLEEWFSKVRGAIWSPRKFLATSGDSFGLYNWGSVDGI